MNVLEINKEVNNRGHLFFDTPNEFFTIGDILKLQNYIANTYVNFDGGFGIYNQSDLNLSSTDDVDTLFFRFTTNKELLKDKARRLYYDSKTNNEHSQKYPFVFRENCCIETIHWLAMLIRLCELHNIPFIYSPKTIDSLIEKSKSV